MRNKKHNSNTKIFVSFIEFQVPFTKEDQLLNNGLAATSFHMSLERAISNEIPQG